MAKIERHKDKDEKQHDINMETGEVTPVTPDLWNPKKRSDYEKCKILVKQLSANAINIITEQSLLTVAHSFAVFGEPGRELFTTVCLHQTQFDTEALKDHFDRALRTAKFKSPQKFVNICVLYGLSDLLSEDDYEYYLIEGIKPVRFTDQVEDEHVRTIQQYGFMELRNQYYFATINREEKRITLAPYTNFVMRVLYHIHRGKDNKRVIALKNNRNESLILEINTKELTSLQAFKNLSEGLGNFVIKPQFKDNELQRIKSKLFEEEKTSTQLEVLGWDKRGFFAFCNGLYQVSPSAFLAVDEYGIVTLNNTHFHIPFHPGTDENNYLNEKKILYRESKTDFKSWAELYLRAFGMVGGTVLTFTCATIFSDHIFGVKNNFPMLFLYGEGGSGKGTVCEFSQHLFGHPQPPLKLTEKANTDKARVRKFATYCNVPVRLEEFSNSIDMAGIKTLTNLYDRFGYERSSMETRYGTETVPIRSTVMITGNEYPADDPLMQRMILQDSDRNSYSDDEIAAFRLLQKMNQEGITSVLIELLGLREKVEQTWRECYELDYDKFRGECKDIDVPSRMIENYAVLLATYKCLNDVGIQWPMKYDDLKEYFKKCLVNQAEKRNTGAVVQKFWDIVLSLASKGAIHEGKEFVIDGPFLYVRFKEIHTLYMEEHLRIYRQPGLLSPTLQQKLKISNAFIESVASMRFGRGSNTSAFKFDYLKLNIDLIYIVNQKRAYNEKELIESEPERIAREEDEKKAKLVRAGEINQQAIEYSQEFKQNIPPPLTADDMPF